MKDCYGRVIKKGDKVICDEKYSATVINPVGRYWVRVAYEDCREEEWNQCQVRLLSSRFLRVKSV